MMCSRLFFFARYLLLGASLLVAFSTPVNASAQNNRTATTFIDKVLISGNKRVEIATIKDNLQLQVPGNFSAEELNDALKRLFATDFFNDVTFSIDSAVLTIAVRENPTINYVVIEGNRRIKSDLLLPLLISRPRTVYKVGNVQDDVKRILGAYTASGRYAAEVVPSVIALENNRVNLVFEVEEGPVTKIQRIVFLGNSAFSDETLVDAISSQEDAWYRFVGNRTNFDEGRVSLDRNLLIQYYHNNGYPKVAVREPQVEIDPSSKNFYVTFRIEEGKPYRFGKSSIHVDIPGFSPDSFSPFLEVVSGDVYDLSAIERSKNAIKEYLGDLAYPFAAASHELIFDNATQTIDVKINVQSRSTAYVEEIKILGNSRTWDDVIRREFRLHEGDTFNAVKVRDSVKRLRDLGIFKTVEAQTTPGTYPDSVVLEITVTEAPTNRLGFSVGYSSSEGALLQGSASEDNLLGSGNSIALQGRISAQSLAGDITYADRYLFDSPVSGTFRLFSIDNRSANNRSYDFYSYGGSVTLGYDLGDYWRQSWTTSIDQRNVSNISENSSRFITSQEGKTLVTSLGQRLSYDRRDSSTSPREGYYISFSGEVGTPPGEVYYLKLTGSAAAYYPLTDSSVLSARLTAGHILGLDGQNVRLIDRFFKGGYSFRGFDYSGIGPRDTTTNDSLGGQSFAIATFASRFDLGLPEEYKIQGLVFTDIGTLTQVDNTSSSIADSGNIRMGYGFGFEWITPVGPLVMLFSNTILRDSVDEERGFVFTIGTFN